MNEIFGDFWRQSGYDLYGITTNGVVKANGRCVMGRGIAQQARDRFMDFDLAVGNGINAKGNVPFVIGQFDGDWYTSFPVKHKWFEKADIELIEQSAKILVYNATVGKFPKILLPRPGCGNGGLEWEDVKPILARIFDDRFTIIERKP